MADTGDTPSGGRPAGLIGKLLRFVVTHQIPAGGPTPGGSRPTGRPTVGLVAGHLVSGGYGDQVVGHVEQALGRRGHVAGSLDTVDGEAPVVIVAHAGPRSRPILSTVGTDAAGFAGRPVAVVAYGPVPAPDPRPLEVLRSTLLAGGARVTDGTVLLDTARLHRPAATCRPGCTPADPFERLTLELVLDDLLARGPAPAPTPPRRPR